MLLLFHCLLLLPLCMYVMYCPGHGLCCCCFPVYCYSHCVCSLCIVLGVDCVVVVSLFIAAPIVYVSWRWLCCRFTVNCCTHFVYRL